jgi:hypothetical protein
VKVRRTLREEGSYSVEFIAQTGFEVLKVLENPGPELLGLSGKLGKKCPFYKVR